MVAPVAICGEALCVHFAYYPQRKNNPEIEAMLDQIAAADPDPLPVKEAGSGGAEALPRAAPRSA